VIKEFAVIVDFSYLFHLAQWPAAQAAATGNYDLATVTLNNLEGKLRTMQRELNHLRVSGYELVFAEDRIPVAKNQLYPPYRNNTTRTNSYQEKQVIKDHLLLNGYSGRFAHAVNQEADDVMATLANRAISAGQHAIVVTGDRDLWQLIGAGCSVYQPIKQRFIQSEDVALAFNCAPRHIALHKTLWGDAADKVPNCLPRLKKLLLPTVRATDGTLPDFQARMLADRCQFTPALWQRYLNAHQQLAINYRLVRLNANCNITWQ
jgi:DNA polymerase-1